MTTLCVLKAGEPVPSVLAAKGDCPAWIAAALGSFWDGGYQTVDVRTAHEPPPLSADAFVITGSAASVAEREEWVVRFESWLRDVVIYGAPIFGICFGHQVLAQALGGAVHRNPRGREMGTVRVERLRDDDPIMQGLPSSFDVNSTHVDTIARLPPGARTLARSALDEHQIVRFAKRCYGAQFHPEMDGSIMRSYIEARREVLTGESFDVGAMLEAVTEAEFGRRVLQNFTRHIV